jgi:hypothetical protein
VTGPDRSDIGWIHRLPNRLFAQIRTCPAFAICPAFALPQFGSFPMIVSKSLALITPPIESISEDSIVINQSHTTADCRFSFVAASQGSRTVFGRGGRENDVVIAATTQRVPSLEFCKITAGRHFSFWPRGSRILAQMIVPGAHTAAPPRSADTTRAAPRPHQKTLEAADGSSPACRDIQKTVRSSELDT